MVLVPTQFLNFLGRSCTQSSLERRRYKHELVVLTEHDSIFLFGLYSVKMGFTMILVASNIQNAPTFRVNLTATIGLKICIILGCSLNHIKCIVCI